MGLSSVVSSWRYRVLQAGLGTVQAGSPGDTRLRGRLVVVGILVAGLLCPTISGADDDSGQASAPEESPALVAAYVPETRTMERGVQPLSAESMLRQQTRPDIRLRPGAVLPEVLLRVLNSRSPHDPYWYPSPFQVGPATVLVSGEIAGAGLERASRPLYLRVVDAGPAAPYELEAVVPRHRGDVELRELGGAPLTRLGSGVHRLSVEMDGAFRVAARFVSADGRQPAAGDGFFVEASLDEAFSCGNECPRTGTFRLWKRVYVERDAMYRRGASIASHVPSGRTRIAVDDVRPFKGARADRPVEVLLIHAPSTSSDRYREESHVVTGIARPDRRRTSGFVELAVVTRGAFESDDAIVVPAGGSFETPSLSTATEVFARAFVELVEIANPHPLVPHRLFRAEGLGEDFSSFAQRWSDYGEHSSTSAQNVLLVVSGDHKTQTLPNGDAVMYPAIGSCNIRPARVNSVFLWQGAVQEQVRQNEKGVGIGGRLPADVIDELVVHEMAHAFGVDDCDSCGGLSGSEGEGLSTMSVPVGPEMGDGVAGFHAIEYMRIRTSVDPLPQS